MMLEARAGVDVPDGVLVVDKVLGPSSHDSVAAARRLLGTRRIGHTGTLDPLATGVLPLVIGRATRLAQFLSAGSKVYHATIALGATTETDDAQGTPLPSGRPAPGRAEVEGVLGRFLGPQLQEPPVYSAKKVQGIRAYALARASQAPSLQAVAVKAFELTLLDWQNESCVLEVACSKGFYVRALARDIGRALGCGAYLLALRRIRNGEFGLADAVTIEALARDTATVRNRVVPLSDLLGWLPTAQLGPEEATRVSHGGAVARRAVYRWLPPAKAPPGAGQGGHVRLTSLDGALLGLAAGSADPDLALPLQPSIVLV